MRLHSWYSSLILAVEIENFHTILNSGRNMKASAIIQGIIKQQVAQYSGSKASGMEKFDLSSLNAAAIRSRKWNKSIKKTKKSKFWNRLNSNLEMGSSLSIIPIALDVLDIESRTKDLISFGLQLITDVDKKDT